MSLRARSVSDGSRMAAENLLLLDRSLTLPALNTAADNFSHVLTLRALSRMRASRNRTGLWVIAGLLLMAVAGSSPFWLVLIVGRRSAAPLPKVVAVLPLLGAADRESRRRLDQLAEQVLLGLSGSRELEVVPFDRSRRFDTDQRNLRAIGSELGADLLVTGRVPAEEPAALRIYLYSATRSTVPFWMGSYPLPTADIPRSLSDRIASDIREAMKN